MISKSIVQERLEAGRNRLEIVVREVESNRMTPTEVAKSLRQIGTYLENIKKMVRSDRNVKFAPRLDEQLEYGMKGLTITIDKLEGEGITGTLLNSNLIKFGKIIESIQELVDLEIEDLA